MWDEPVPSAEDDAQPFEEPDPAANVAWTDGQLMRLENEWHRAQRSFAYHPYVGITPVRGDPPHEYQLDYRVRTLVMNEGGELQYVDEVSMHVWLPPGFPNQPPVARPLAGVFHPNIAWEGVYLSQPWQNTDTLVDFATRIGELLAYRNYDPESVVNAVAMDWMSENNAILPLDRHADFSPFAGGEPLGRIQRLGPATLEQIRRALDDMRFALLGEEGAPTAAEVEEFSRQTRVAASLFLDRDVPDNLREQASEFDDWCRELPVSVPLWEYLRNQRSRASAGENAAIAVTNAAAALSAAFKELEGLVQGVTPSTPASAVKVIPTMPKLQPIQQLPPLVRDFEQRVNDLRRLLDAMKETAPEVAIAEDGSLGRRLAAQKETVNTAVASAVKSGQAALWQVEPLIRRAKPETLALAQVVGWREYMDMFAKARKLEIQVTEWGSAGAQSFFLGNSSGSFGPFQYEEPIDLGGTRIVVRNSQGGAIEVIDAVGQDVLGRGAEGTATIVIGQSEGTPGHRTDFRLTGRCDDLTIQFDYIFKQTAEALAALQRPVSGATSWCGTISLLLADARQQQNLRDAHRKAGHRWKALMTDLAHLAKFKERVATHHLVERMTEEVPRVQELINTLQEEHKDATEKVQQIMGKSSRDVETDRLIVPPKYVKAYTDELRVRDRAKHEIARLQGLLKQIARDLSVRLSTPRLCGRPEVPRFRALAPVPDEMAALQEKMSDTALAARVKELSERLQVQLTVNAPPAPPAATASRPAQPTIGPSATSLDFPNVDKPAGSAPPPPPRTARPTGPPPAVNPAAPAAAQAGKPAQPPAPPAPPVQPPPKTPAAPVAAEAESEFPQSAQEVADPGDPYAEPLPDEDIIADFFGDEAQPARDPGSGK